MKRSKIIGLGHYVPEKVVTNHDLEKFMDTNDKWIRERTGIEERRWVTPESGDNSATMGVKAAQMAIKKANISADDIDFIIFATLSPNMFFPGPAVFVQQELCNKRNIGALDIRQQCSGFIYGISIADQYIKSGMYKNILVIGAETHSPILDISTAGRGISVLFGDGAGAIVLTATNQKNKGLLSTHLYAQGTHAKQLCFENTYKPYAQKFFENKQEPLEPKYMYMNGNFVFKHAVTRFYEVIQEALEQNKLSKDDLTMFVPHQANLRITQFVQRKMGLSDEQVYSNIQKYGNTSAATIPIALSELNEAGRLKDNDLVALASFGAGFTWSSALIRW